MKALTLLGEILGGCTRPQLIWLLHRGGDYSWSQNNRQMNPRLSLAPTLDGLKMAARARRASLIHASVWRFASNYDHSHHNQPRNDFVPPSTERLLSGLQGSWVDLTSWRPHDQSLSDLDRHSNRPTQCFNRTSARANQVNIGPNPLLNSVVCRPWRRPQNIESGMADTLPTHHHDHKSVLSHYKMPPVYDSTFLRAGLTPTTPTTYHSQ